MIPAADLTASNTLYTKLPLATLGILLLVLAFVVALASSFTGEGVPTQIYESVATTQQWANDTASWENWIYIIKGR